MYTHTATFYTEQKQVKWLDENGKEFQPTPEQKLLHEIFGHFTREEVVTTSDLFTIQYKKVSEMNTLWLQKSEELGYHPSDVLLRRK